MMITNYYIIADLHLNESRPQTTDLFKTFLDDISHMGNALFILGDFFDYWVGDDVTSPMQEDIIKALHDAHDKGLTIYFMHGNRDFLIGKSFTQKAKVTLINDPYLLQLKHKNIVLMHGDLLCTDDKSYQMFRYVVRTPVVKKLYLSLSAKTRQRIAQKIRAKSKQKNEKYKIIDVTPKGIKRYLGDNKVLIHGHTHLFNTHHEKNYTRYVLGDWFNTGSYIHIDHDENIRLLKLDAV
ncbi:UDP-2,3-diacylglucosamine diphosphatase [Cysteiniphilum sp. JM-1]|uniref:UDP-2,3-diacylglucosamine diphosphatase n=1 Tax=Cysteiniphilum sp. JM-1 TaxID=2610891 RepID=UPI0012464D2C|nr:UDP-2,3-diacylglucosamine diphosphatase [Cysteiniphilum sp. JM-1]